jgi:membrane associated rhomboid family serine protease
MHQVPLPTGSATNLDRGVKPIPWMNLSLGLFCALATGFYAWLTPWQQHVMLEALGASPTALVAMFDSGNAEGLRVLAPVLALFIHSGWLHLVGNLTYFWVFGWPLERRLGHWPLALLFLLGGVAVHLALALRLPTLELPVIGASGAVSAVLGAYLGLIPRRSIGLWVPLGVIVEFVRVPALLVIGSWFVLQLVYAGFGPISWQIAFWTHLAGFSLGLMLALLVRAGGVLLGAQHRVYAKR